MRGSRRLLGIFVGLPTLCLSAAVATALECGDTLTADLTLEADLACEGDGLVVTGEQIELNLGGHTISGGAGGVGITVRGRGVRVRGGRVEGFGTAVLLDHEDASAGGHELRRLELVGWSEVGVQVRGEGLQDLVAKSRIEGDGGGTGVSLFDRSSGASAESGVAVIKSEIAHARTAIDVSEGGRTWLSENEIHDVFIGVAMGENEPTRIRGNRFDRVEYGVDGSESAARIEYNVFRGGGIAIDSDVASFSIEHNEFHDHRIGVRTGTNGELTRIERNFFRGNLVGVEVDEGDGTMSIAGNRFVGNGAAGILVHDGWGIPILDNLLRANGHAPEGLVDANGAAVDDGLHVEASGSPPPEIGGNRALRNADYGIEAPEGLDVGGNLGRRNGNPAQCLGVDC